MLWEKSNQSQTDGWICVHHIPGGIELFILIIADYSSGRCQTNVVVVAENDSFLMGTMTWLDGHALAFWLHCTHQITCVGVPSRRAIPCPTYDWPISFDVSEHSFTVEGVFEAKKSKEMVNLHS